MGQDPAFEKRLELLTDVPGDAFALVLGKGFEGSVILCNGLIEYGLLGTSRTVFAG
jgi:hypothetical protein